MLRLLLLSVFSLFCMVASAQSAHLKFQGIPIDGPLIEFEQKLAAKGYYPDSTYNQSDEAIDNRLYHGQFAGADSEVYITFSPQNQNVYLVTVVFKTSTEENMLAFYNQMKKSLSEGYPKAFLEYDSYEGYEACTFYIRRYSSDTTKIWKRCYGSIGVACYKADDIYNVFLDFTDQKNGDLHQRLQNQ